VELKEAEGCSRAEVFVITFPGSVHSIIIGAKDLIEELLLLELRKPADDRVISPTEMFGTILRGSLMRLIIEKVAMSQTFCD
jgi:hypothetical protein